MRTLPRIALLPGFTPGEPKTYTVRGYEQGVLRAGGFPVTLPLTDRPEILEQAAHFFDGFLFVGGKDLHPRHYGQEVLEACGLISPENDAMDLALMKKVLALRKPIFGICRGCQTMNVALGGDLYQDIPSQIPRSAPCQHRQQSPDNVATHRVTIREDSLLYRIVGQTSLMVNSLHHQAIGTPAPGTMVSAIASDGVSEAIERSDDSFFLGVQWHPERLLDTEPHAMKLFSAFVKACSRS